MHDWSASPLGSPGTWPASLRTVVGLMLTSKFPMFVAWGPELAFLYNDGYAPILGSKHPHALGRPFHAVWSEIWNDIEPLVNRALAGEATFNENLHLVMERHGFPEDTWYTFSYSPVRDDGGAIAGMFCACTETTEKVQAERRARFHIELSERLATLSEPRTVTFVAARALGTHIDADRVGYGEVDETEQVVAVEQDWTRGVSIASLAGEARILDAFGPAVIATLRAGRTLIVEDCLEDPRVGEAYAATWSGIGCRSLIVTPLIKYGRFRALLYVHESTPRHWTSTEIMLVERVAHRTWDAVERARIEKDLRDREAVLRENEQRLRATYEHVFAGIGEVDRNGRFLRANERLCAITGYSREELFGRSFWDLTHLDDREADLERFSQLMLGRTDTYTVEKRYIHKDGHEVWVEVAASRVDDPSGQPLYGISVIQDISTRKRAEEHQRLLIHELNHRVKNTLATVQSIATQTLRGSEAPIETREALESRLFALSRAHNVLTRENWEGALLHEIIEDVIEPYSNGREGRIRLQGGKVHLIPRMALALSMAVHELATNAAKYGALSNGSGEVHLTWMVDRTRSQPLLLLRWEEKGGPAVRPPSRQGFGSRLIERSLAYDLNGTVQIDFHPAGLICSVEAPLPP
ncbi:PAS domain-containing sensor histidine kinase [Microvirga sp. CF3016]|uniref:PAS domain-containing sensor histidine kinase n=1 Tax=Microvirga sp. CF3016 TaxID=3110181 RepID=UPI002E79FE01|nr:PAS domain S-box protein [Microvirga sp. CF3016]MEE1613741.1 PAS domain S-box protein [Microvirga sp. CF3016]